MRVVSVVSGVAVNFKNLARVIRCNVFAVGLCLANADRFSLPILLVCALALALAILGLIVAAVS